ncbi:MAG: Holliday junction branch migration protein RuvA [Terriglobia bacterium]
MIAHLRGRLLSKTPNRVIIEAGGVGYDVSIPVSTFYELGEVETEVSLHVYTYVREEAFALYGFRTAREKSLFEKLLGVAGVGPKLAVTLLSGLEIEDLVTAIRKGEITRLVSIPGVGRKTAERLIVELREKLAAFAIEEPEQPAAAAVQPGSVEDDVVSALVNLGYARAAAESALREARAASPAGDFEDWLRGSLRLLARKFFR